MSTTKLQSVLIFGGNGFLGQRIAQQILNRKDGTKVAVVGRSQQKTQPGIEYHVGDINSESSVRNIFDKVQPRVVFNCVAPISFPRTGTAETHYKINVEGTTTLLRAAAACPSTVAFIYTSSALMLVKTEYSNANEDSPINMNTEDGRFWETTKAVADNLTRRANNTLPPSQGGIRTATIRPCAIFGENDKQVLKTIMDQLEASTHKVQLGNNTSQFDFVYVGNVAAAQILAAEALLKEAEADAAGTKKSQARISGEAFIITNDEHTGWYDFCQLAWSQAGNVENVPKYVVPTWAALSLGSVSDWTVWLATLGSTRPNLTRDSVEYVCLNRTHDCTKAKERLGYRPLVSIEEGVKRSVKTMLDKGKA
ncbi:Sterol-4-alpha-carboxylate 3-dehydrogenase-like protein [Elsinoe fawcettii]|nr:Sterol-4-alpha-carboxylate 3-dehydrogenase-like protein [Elsinoe fawcettii]